jgi:hypothetical protein
VFGLEKVYQEPYNLFIKLMESTLCDFWAFPTTERELRGKKTTWSTIILTLAANGLQHVFEKWMERCKKCISCQRGYFEKETDTAPPQSSDSE